MDPASLRRSRAREPLRSAGLAWGAIFAAGAVVACTPATVVRVIDGREVTGRFVSDRAYALYARGAEAEARGDLEGARLEYLAAAEQDEGNAEVWTRVGAVSCGLGRDDGAREAFDAAAARAPEYEPLYRERARCALSRTGSGGAGAAASGDGLRAAFEDATRSLSLDPDSEDAALLYARAAEATGDAALAERALRELVVRLPGRAAGWRALRDLAARRKDGPAVARATAALETLGDAANATFADGAAGPKTGDAAPTSSAGPTTGNVAPTGRADPTTSITAGAPTSAARASGALEDVDAAIARGSLDDARTAAKRARLQPAELAVRAAALGRAQLAKTQAELVFKADPSNASAAIALAVASDLLRDDAGVTSALATPASLTTSPSPLARLLFTELIQRRADREAALAYAGTLVAAPEGTEPLLRAVTDRVRAGLAK